MPRTHQERTDATKNALIEAARTLFVSKGFAAASTSELVQAAGVTRGALYHHFTDKTDLFVAVALRMAEEVATAVSESSDAQVSPLDALRTGAAAYFSAMGAHGRARLLLLEAPSVISAEQMAVLSDAAGAGALEEGLRAALTDASELPIEALTAVLSAAFDRAALAVAMNDQPAHYKAAISLLIESIALVHGRSTSDVLA